MNTTYTPQELTRQLRIHRESKGLTLVQAAALSEGRITPIALGSYERGDRSLSVTKLMEIATMYGIPVTELLAPSIKQIQTRSITIDLRKVRISDDRLSKKLFEVLANIAYLRGDWNGEVISLRENDVRNFSVFSLFSPDEIEEISQTYRFTRSK